MKIGNLLKYLTKKPCTGNRHFAGKRNSKENIEYKERYVARGFRQKQGVDYDQTYSPTVKIAKFC